MLKAKDIPEEDASDDKASEAEWCMIDEQILLLAVLEALVSALLGGIRTAFLPRTEKALGEWAKWGKGDWTGVGGWELKIVGDGAIIIRRENLARWKKKLNNVSIINMKFKQLDGYDEDNIIIFNPLTSAGL